MIKAEKSVMELNPYSHLLIEDAFGVSSLLDSAFPSEGEFNKSFRMDKDMTYPMKNYLNLIIRNKTYNALHNYIYSTDFVSLFLKFFKDEILKNVVKGDLLFNPFELPIIGSPYELSMFKMNQNLTDSAFLFPRLDLGYGGVDYGKNNGGGGVHTDNLGRLISIIYYVNSPKDMLGGEHRIYGIQNKKPLLERIIEPKEGRLIASLQTNTALHDVNPITKIKGYRKAFYLAISCNKPIWRNSEDWLMKLTRNRDPQNIIHNGKSLKSKLKVYLMRKLLFQ